MFMDNRRYTPRKAIPPPEVPPTPQDWAYLAGFIDSDGCIGAAPPRERGGNAQVTLMGRQANSVIPLYLQSRFGGSVHKHVRGKNNFNPGAINWTWRVSSRQEVGYLLKGMLPYLVYKEPQAQVALRLCQRKLPSLERQRELVALIRKLKRIRR